MPEKGTLTNAAMVGAARPRVGEGINRHAARTGLIQYRGGSAVNASYGRIINIISTSVKEPIAGLGVSNTGRAAVAAWAKTRAGELVVDGITVNSVPPGFTRTQRLDSLLAAQSKSSGRTEQDVAESFLASVPAKRFGEAAEVAAVAAFLCTPAAAYVNGVSISGDGGRSKTLS